MWLHIALYSTESESDTQDHAGSKFTMRSLLRPVQAYVSFIFVLYGDVFLVYTVA